MEPRHLTRVDLPSGTNLWTWQKSVNVQDYTSLFLFLDPSFTFGSSEYRQYVVTVKRPVSLVCTFEVHAAVGARGRQDLRGWSLLDQLHRSLVQGSTCRSPWDVKTDPSLRAPLVNKLQQCGFDGWFEPFNNVLWQMEVCLFSVRRDLVSTPAIYDDSMASRYPSPVIQIHDLQPRNILLGTEVKEAHVRQAKRVMDMYHSDNLTTCLDDYIQKLYDRLVIEH